MDGLTIVILAAGEGKRMRSRQPKVFHRLCGRPLLGYALRTARVLADRIVVVAGPGAAPVRAVAGAAGGPPRPPRLRRPRRAPRAAPRAAGRAGGARPRAARRPAPRPWGGPPPGSR